MMSYLSKITQYFKQSLIDSERLSPEDKTILPLVTEQSIEKQFNDHVLFSRAQWGIGEISLDETSFIFKQKKVPSSISEVELLLFPRVDLYSFNGSHSTQTNRRVLVPLCVFVGLNRQGKLTPGSTPPWIPREWISPNASSTQPFAEYTSLDDYLTQNPYENVKNWEDLVRYCVGFLAAVTANTEIHDDTTPNSLYEIPLHPNYAVTKHGILQLELPIIGAKAKIIGVLESILKEKEFPPLYEKFVTSQNTPLNVFSSLTQDAKSEKLHIAQMTGEFPLSEHQRNSLHYFIKQQSGEILAVNGPPGTGKTTLLRSVVANLWTSAALEEGEPPLIFAASNNNQAVTNILESFARIDEDGMERLLKGRWLPNLESYGLYCCASGLLSKTPYLNMDSRGEGSIKDFLDKSYVDNAKEFFVERSSEWAKQKFDSVTSAQTGIHHALKLTVDKIQNVIEEKERFITLDKIILQDYKSLAALNELILTEKKKLQSLIGTQTYLKSAHDKIQDLWERRSILIHLFFWIPSIRKTQYRKTERLLLRLVDQPNLDCFGDLTVETWFRNRIKETASAQSIVEASINKAEQLLKAYREIQQNLSAFIEEHEFEPICSNFLEKIAEVLDRGLRFKAFKLATHYWEARWLMEAIAFLQNPDPHEKGPASLTRRYRRHAKLTPCFVSTFYMLPTLLTAWKGEDKPLYSTADLLVVDEAGQALAEVSAASFALAKKALVVGDTDQIEPVWSVPEKVDIANLEKFGLFKDGLDYEEYWKESGLLASNGNVMRIAQRQSSIHQYEKLSRGLYLTEHRRCYNPIIEYCNELVYQGILKPLRGEPKNPSPWPMLGFQPVNSISLSQGGSRINDGEAKSIANWIQCERQSILRYAVSQQPSWSSLSEAQILKRSLAVVTPFSRQAQKINQYLNAANIPEITVGTVHKLQGDERLIVIFSSVYGSTDLATGKFYDRGCNMLNVAVSRAKDSFIAFGHPDIFGIGSRNSPSGLLRSKLTPLPYEREKQKLNELTVPEC